MITDAGKVNLYVLVRSMATWAGSTKDEVLTFLTEQEFTTEENQPLETYQGDDCLYPKGFCMYGSGNAVIVYL